MPRRQILSSEEKERLLIVPDDDVFLTRMCFLSEHDLALINKHRRPANRLGFAVLLCYLRGPGFLPDKSISPHDGVVFRLAAHLKVQSDLWAEYASREVTRWEHLAELYRYLELSPFNRALQKTCIRHLYPHAMRTDRGFLLAEEMLSWLHNNKVIFPSVEVIERTLAEATTLADRAVFSALTAQLEPGHKAALDRLLVSEGEQPSRLAWLLQQTGKLIQSKLKQYVTVGQALLNARESGEDPWAAIEDVLPWQEFINSVEETRFLSRKDNFDPLHLITEKYSTLRKYAPRMLSVLQFRAAPAAMQLSDALDTVRDMYRKQLRKVPPFAPIGFIPESWRKVVITPTGIDRKYYEFCVLNELKGALRSGDIWVKGSRRYRNFDDYLIPSDDFEKSLRDNQLPLAVPADCHGYIKSRLTLLASRLEEVNAMALAGDLPDVDISDKGVKITPLDNSVPSAASPFGDLVYGMLPHPKITEMLDEVDGWTGFTHHFTHLKNNHVRPKDRKLLLTTILADGINLGLTKMAESCPGTTKSSLEGIQAWYIRDETYSAALAELVNAQKKRPLAAFWGDGTTSSSDGQNFRVGSHGRYAGQVNLKYGQDPGVQIYTHISDQYSPFYTKVISRVRDSTHVLDGLLYHETDLEITEHYTDTAGFTEHVFALMHLLGFAFAPRIRDLHDKRLFIQGKAELYQGLQSIISTTSLNLKEIETHWHEVLRLASSLKQGTVTASLMMKKLASYPKQNGLAKALREIGRIERSLFMLDWFRDPLLRRRVQAGLNKGEARNALARAVFMHRLGEIRDRGLENQSYRASGLTLLTAAISLWNTVYIERAIDSLRRKGIPITEQLITHLSPLGWEHINLSGDYVWRTNLKLGKGKYRALRSVNSNMYKKQA
ncbi:tn3 transposase DDE domain protein [Enterobacteriaceae bacterium ATCC 29904]|nr:tn3 transposase DDE domain protein [Enterobacteriaceae bacterium ATCC 29904]